MSEIAISVKAITKSFETTTALAGLTLDFPSGAISALVGPDGAGKTTLLRVLAGIMDIDSGEVEVYGENYRKGFDAKKAVIGYMPQRFGLYEDLTVQENIDFFADLFSVKGSMRRERTERLFEFSRLQPFAKRLAGKLSGGMKQKLGLACALIHNPRILLLDEPTNGVDPVSRRDFWQLLYELNREGVTIVISSPYMDEAERANYFALIHQGRLISNGVPSEARNDFSWAVHELTADQPRRVRELLSGQAMFKSVTIFGKGVHLVTDKGIAIDEVKLELTRQGIEYSDLRTILPTFEDIYISQSAYSYE